MRPEHEPGYCVICGSRSEFHFDPTIITPQLQKAWGISDDLVTAFNRKESMFCDYCGSSLRIRRLAAVLIETLSQTTQRFYKSFIELLKDEEFRRLKIAEINGCGALHSYLKDHPNLYYSEWVPHAEPGEVHDGVRCEDLQCLTYPDNCFDIILTSETLEHVPNPDRAWHEIYRTLKGGGYHIFTIPIIPSRWQTIQRAGFVKGARKDVCEPAYHGDWGREDVFVYTDFGMDVVEKLDKMGLSTKIFYSVPQVEFDVAMVFRSLKNGGQSDLPTKPASPLLEWTGERYLPWLEEAAIGYEHLHRYAYATQFVQKKKVLDLACGEGYGSCVLAKTAEFVVGIDIEERAIKHARNKYIKQNLDFKVGSITEIPISGEHLFDVAVCFEALEHVEDHQKLLSEVKRLLTPQGVFIVSTPNKTVYSDEPQYNNPFHVRELYFDEFKELFEKHFKNVRFFGQRIYCNSNIWPVFPGVDSEIVEYVIDRHQNEFVIVENDKRTPLYFIAIASDTDCAIEYPGSTLVDISNGLLKEKDAQIAAHSTEQQQLGQEVAQLQLTVQSQQQILAEKDQQIVRLTTERNRSIQDVTHLQSEMAQLQLTVQSQHESLTEKQKELTQLVAEKDRHGREISQVRDVLQAREEYIGAIENSAAWTLLVKYRRLRDKMFPEGTRRRQIYNFLKNSCTKLAQSRPLAQLPHGVEPGLRGETEQSVSPSEKSQRSITEITRTKLISQRPDELVLAKLSVVIPTKNGMSEGFESALRAISRQRGIGEIEVTVVDSGSSDGTVDAAKNYGAKVFQIRPEDFNHGATRNLGADQTTGDLIVFTVQDAIPASEDLFYEMAKALLRDPKLAGVSVRQLPKSDADHYACWERWNHNRFHLEAPPEQLLQLAGLDNVCSMVKRSVWEKIRFPTTQYAEDLEFGLACFRQGYKIAWLSERATIHSHNRPPFYYMSRHYADRRVMFELLKERSSPWVETVTVDQLFSAVKASYLALNEFVSSIESSAMHEPQYVLRESVTWLSFWRGLTRETESRRGERSLSDFFAALDGCFKRDLPEINPSIQVYDATINSILEFIGHRYPSLSGLQLISLIYKAYAAVAGNVFGDFYFSGSQREALSSPAERLGDLLAVGYRK